MLHPATVHVADNSSMPLHLWRAIELFDNTDVLLGYQGRNQLIGGAAMSIDPTWGADGVTVTMEGQRWTLSTSIGEYPSVDRERRDVYTWHWPIDGAPQSIVHVPAIGGQLTDLADCQLIGLTGEAWGAAAGTISTGGFFGPGSNLTREMSISAVDLAAWPSDEKGLVGFWPHRNRYLTPQTPVAERIDELILEEQGHEDLLLDRLQQAKWLKQVMASYWGIHLPQPFMGFDLDDGLFIASWQSDSECNTLTIDAKEHKGWYDPWPASESDNPVPGEIDLETEEAWDRVRSALTTTRS